MTTDYKNESKKLYFINNNNNIFFIVTTLRFGVLFLQTYTVKI